MADTSPVSAPLSRLGPIPQNAIPILGRFLELESQRADSLRFLKRNQSSTIVGPIPQITILIPRGFLPKSAKEPAPCYSGSRNGTKPTAKIMTYYHNIGPEIASYFGK